VSAAVPTCVIEGPSARPWA